MINQLNEGVAIDEVWLEIVEALSAYNSQKSALAGLLSFRTTQVADVVAQGQQVPLLEEATEFGTPRGIADPTFLSLGLLHE